MTALRFGLFTLALLAGVALALATQGRIGHLRRAAPDLLPGWTAAIADDASLLAGQARIGPTGPDPLTLAWRADRPVPLGPVWQLRLTGPGTDLRARLQARWTGDGATVDAGSGQLDLAVLPLSLDGLAGLVDIAALDATLSRRPGSSLPRIVATATGDWLGAGFRGTALGSGPVAARIDPAGTWRLGAEPSGPLGQVSAQLSGRLGMPLIGLTLTVPDHPDLPEDWRRALQFGGDLKDGAWTLRQRLPMAGG